MLSGNFTIHKNLDNDVIVKAIISRKQISGKYAKVMASATPLCEQIQNDDKYYPILAKVSNFPMPAPCPYPKGEYFINNFKVDEEFLPSLLPLGEYLVEVQLVLADEVIFGYNVYSTVTS